MANPSVFEDYFRRADVDNDGRVSGTEAVSFFQGANLPQVTLAKIWQFADQGHTGFLSRLEFYNALKLVTVAQTGRELTPEIVRAALAGPAAAQIPAPRINTPSPQPPPSHPPSSAPSQTQSGSFPDQFSSGPGAPPRSWSSQPTPMAPNNSGPPPSIPRPGSGSGQRAPGGFSADTWPSIRSSSGVPAPPQAPATAPPPAHYHQGAQGAQHPQARNTAPGQGFQSGSENLFSGAGAAARSTPGPFTSTALVDAFGGDPFAATSQPVVPVPAKSGPSSSLSQSLSEFGNGGFRAEPSTMALVSTSGPSRDASKDAPQAGTIARSGPSSSSAGMGQGFGAPPPVGPGPAAPWPRMTESDVQRYRKVFTEVDTDRDGKITGEQARDLFLSWRLPREVLKQVWDLSDQDGDSMLSMREFCTALYLMERYREGRPLPPVLPSGLFDDDKQPDGLMSQGSSQIEQNRSPLPSGAPRYNGPGWQQHPGLVQPTSSGPVANHRLGAPATAAVPQVQSPAADTASIAQYKSKAPGLEMHLVNQLPRDEQDTLKSRHKDAEEAEKKDLESMIQESIRQFSLTPKEDGKYSGLYYVGGMDAFELDKEIMDYREKAEFYRSKLQEIILFKSRCENRLGEITERAAADKREMESLAKKYDGRFKAAGEVNSRLLAEEAAFRDIQERKIELYNAIAKMEQGGDANGLMQSKADRIASDLDELKKALNDRARRLGLNVKAAAPTEQSFGWQPGLQEKAVDWDEDWDKFDDEGFVSIQDIMDDAMGGNVTASTPKSAANWEESNSFGDQFDSKAAPTLVVPNDQSSGQEHPSFDHTSPRAESEGSGRSGLESPVHDVSTSSSQAVDKSAGDKPPNPNKASQRYANLTESQEDVFHGPTSYSSTTNSDAFGDGAPWSAAFSHDDDVDSGIRASWGLQSNAPSTQASFDVAGSRTSRFGRTGLSSQGFGDSLDMGSIHVSSPGRGTDVSSPTLSHPGNGNFRDSGEFDRFGSLGSSKDFDRSPRLFGNNHNTRGSAFFDSPRKSGAGNDRSFTRFDSFSSSPQNNPGFQGFGDDRHDHSYPGTGKDSNDRTYARFDSFTSTKGDGGQARPGSFGAAAFDDGDEIFSGSGTFTATQEKKSDHGWSAF